MEQKTAVKAIEGAQEIIVTRTFDLPVELLFKAYQDPALFEQWMETKVIKMENKNHGSYAFETSRNGMVVFRGSGTIHEFTTNKRIIRTFEMENTPFPPQLEYLEFEKITDETSKLTMQMIFKSADFRNQLLQMPFAEGINMAHNNLQKILSKNI